MNEINNFKDAIFQILVDAIESTVPNFEKRNLDIKAFFFRRMSNINCYENSIHVPEFNIPFSNILKLHELHNSMIADLELHWNKFELTYNIGAEPKLKLIWDQEDYDKRMKEAEKNIKHRR